MIGYKDRAWCRSPNCKGKCGRQFTQADHEAAVRWWGGEDYPLAFGYFCDENGEVKG